MNYGQNNYYYPQLQYQQPVATTRGYDPNGQPVYVDVYNPPAQQQSSKPVSLGANFSGLIGNNVTVPISNPIITETDPTIKKKKKSSKKDDSNSVELTVSPKNGTSTDGPVNSKEIVESTVYADTYVDTNNLTYGIINQTDELLRDAKQELDYIRSQRNMKGRIHYMNATIESMSSLLSTKLNAIKEINSTIKTVNDNEYRRFKDMRAMENIDDNKAVMDAYTAFISAPVGTPQYTLPGTTNMTAGLNGVIRADYPENVQANMDIGMANYLANLTPEENLMLHDNNKDIEEVIVYDQATGAKRLQWMNTATGEMMNNMPPSSNLTIEDFTIDPRTRLAKNTNLNIIKKVVVLNEGAFDRF